MDDLITWLRAQLDLDERYADEYPPFQARVLREVEAKRRLLRDFGGFFGLDDFSRGLVEHSFKLMALPFSDRPGYREEWKP